MKTRTKTLVGILVALLPAALATVAIQLEDPREFIRLGEPAEVSQADVTFLSADTVRPDRTFSEAVKYELGLVQVKPQATPRRHHRHHHHRAHNVSLKTPVAGVGAHKAAPCTRRDGITICDPKALTRTKTDRRPRRSRSWYLPERETQKLEPFGE